MNEESIRGQLRAEKARAGLTYAEIAAATGLTKNQVEDRLAGSTRITISDVERMARAFGVTPLDIFTKASLSAA